MSPTSSLRQRIGALTFGVAILALVTLVCFVAAIFFGVRFVEDIVGLVSHNLASRSGLSLYLVEGLVIFATIPFFWAIVMFTKNVWGLFKLGWNFVALYKNKYGMIVVGYVGLYFVVMYIASLNAFEYKYCAETPEGIFTSDSPGKDPIYGVALKPCNRDQILAVRGSHVKAPNEILIKDAEHFEWFDRVTGQPRVWYSIAKEHTYRFFDGQGVDPYNQQALKPVTAEIAEQVKHRQAVMASVQQDAVNKAAADKIKEAAGARQAQLEAEMSRRAQQAEASFEARDYQSAIDTCLQVLASQPRNQKCTSVKEHASINLSEQLVNEGLAHWEKGEFDEAKLSAEKALNLNPTNQRAIKLKALANDTKARAAH